MLINVGHSMLLKRISGSIHIDKFHQIHHKRFLIQPPIFSLMLENGWNVAWAIDSLNQWASFYFFISSNPWCNIRIFISGLFYLSGEISSLIASANTDLRELRPKWIICFIQCYSGRKSRTILLDNNILWFEIFEEECGILFQTKESMWLLTLAIGFKVRNSMLS